MISSINIQKVNRESKWYKRSPGGANKNSDEYHNQSVNIWNPLEYTLQHDTKQKLKSSQKFRKTKKSFVDNINKQKLIRDEAKSKYYFQWII